MRKQYTIRLLFIISLLLIAGINGVQAQSNNDSLVVYKKTDRIDTASFSNSFFEELLFNSLNNKIEKEGKSKFKSKNHLKRAAQNQATYMGKVGDATTFQIFREHSTTALRVQMYGGSMIAREIAIKNSISNGSGPGTYELICNEILDKIFNNSKKHALFLSNEFDLIGIGAQLGLQKKKVYVSFVLSNYKSNTEGRKFVHELREPYTNEYYNLTSTDARLCRKVNRMQNAFELQKSLKVEGNTIYYETENVKSLKRLLRNPHDGIAVDILQKEQFPCNHANVINYNHLNRGILTKRVFRNKLFNKNIANTEDNRYALKTEIGTLPASIKDNYELNLVLIQEKSICKIIPQSYINYASGKYKQSVSFLANLNIERGETKYKPVADSMILEFKIPFEVNKYSYNSEDVEPFLKLLNQPEFIIYNLHLTAYSSIEGSEKENVFLQKQRAQSILNALKARQKEDINTKITTAFNWNDFAVDIQNTKFKELALGTMAEAQQAIRDKNLKEELEPILQKHRYANLRMSIRYNIEGANEQSFVVKEFNDAICEGNDSIALRIQKYIAKKVLGKKYPASAIYSLNIPFEDKYSTLELNKLYLLHKLNLIPDSVLNTQINELASLEEENNYVNYNQLLYSLLFSSDEQLANDNRFIQSKIDRLYSTDLPTSAIDELNIKYQMKLISSADSVAVDEKLRSTCVDNLKSIVNIKEETMNNSLKLAEIFMENEDFFMARKALEQWIGTTTDENLIFTYLSLCTIDEWYMHTPKFIDAARTAKNINKERFCNLFFNDKFSYRVFENQEVKKLYCKECKQ